MTIKEDIKNELLANRPNLSENSIKTYVSILSNLYKKVFPGDEHKLSNFNKQDEIIEYLNDVDGSKRKTILASLVVLCKDHNDKYTELMNQDSANYSKEQKKQKRTEKQTENWVEQDELTEIISNLKEQMNEIMKSRTQLSMTGLQKIQNYVMLCLMSGLYMDSIRRALDWSEMKIKNATEDDNEIILNSRKQSKFIFRKYKTARFLGVQEEIISPELKKILTKWLSLLTALCPDNEYLFIDNNCNKLTPVKINQRLNKIFGRKASVNILLHSLITEKYKNLPSLEEMKEDAERNGHTLMQELEYIKR